MELEEAIKVLQKTIKSNNEIIKEARKNGDINTIQLTASLDNDSIAIETVLEELKENKEIIEQLTYTIQNSIPKKKIEDKILQEWKKCPKNSINDFAIVERNNKIQVLQELLEDK